MADLTGKNISATYTRLVQVSESQLYDGSGGILPIQFDSENVIISGTLTAQTYVVSESVTAVTSGSTIFGNSSDDTHQFTGSANILGNITASGNISSSGNLTVSNSITIGSPLGEINFPTSLKLGVDGGNDYIKLNDNIIQMSVGGSTAFEINDNSNKILLGYSGITQVNIGAHNAHAAHFHFTSGGDGEQYNNFYGEQRIGKYGDVAGDSLATVHITGSGHADYDGTALELDGNMVATGSINVIGNITASVNISTSGDIYGGDHYLSNLGSLVWDTGGTNQTVLAQAANHNLQIYSGSTKTVNIDASAGNITASGDISSSGVITAEYIELPANGAIRPTINNNTISFRAASHGSGEWLQIGSDTFDVYMNGGPSLNMGPTEIRFNNNNVDQDFRVNYQNSQPAILADGASGFIRMSGPVVITRSGSIVRTPGGSGNYGVPTDPNSALELSGSLWTDGHITASGNISSSGNIIAGTINIESGTDAELGSGGYLIVGTVGSSNLAIDNNEILARNNGAESHLNIQHNGGDVRVHNGQAGTEFIINDSGHVTASGHISASGKFYGNEFNFGRANDYIRNLDGGIAIKSDEQRLSITGNITASGNISSSGDLTIETVDSKGDQYKLSGTKALWVSSGTVVGRTTTKTKITGSSIILGQESTTHITASGNISSSGHVQAAEFRGIGTTTALEVGGYISGSEFRTTGHITASGNISSSGTITANELSSATLRLSSTTDASATSTGHAFQSGPTSAANVIINGNEVMARNNGAVAALYINPDGGMVAFQNSEANSVQIDHGHVTASGNISCSGELFFNQINGGSF